MEKNFDKWNEEKKKIDKSIEFRGYHSREVWWCKLGVNVGFEQDGKDEEFLRPVLIIKSFGKNTCLIGPLTTSPQIHKYRINIGKVNDKEASVILSQIKVIDTKRLLKKVSRLEVKEFERIIKNLKEIL